MPVTVYWNLQKIFDTTILNESLSITSKQIKNTSKNQWVGNNWPSKQYLQLGSHQRPLWYAGIECLLCREQCSLSLYHVLSASTTYYCTYGLVLLLPKYSGVQMKIYINISTFVLCFRLHGMRWLKQLPRFFCNCCAFFMSRS